ncbi:MAG: IS3 family transposase [Bacillota bacterium]|nr:IS3 family transposase [Bacillota bacterium]
MWKNYPPSFKAQVAPEILKEEKTISQLAAEHGIHPNQLTRWRNQAVKQLPQLLADDRKGIVALKAGYEKQIEELYAEVGRLTTQLAWLKKKVSMWSRDQRLALLDWGDADLPLKTQAELLGLNRSSLYYQPVAPSPEEIALKNRIDEIYTAHPYYGSRRITAELCRQGFHVNRKAVQRHMREMGIAGICPGPNLSKRNSDHRVYPYLLRGLAISHPNHVWGIDITYIRLRRSWLYLVAIMDWYSRYVVSWELDQSLEISFVLVAVQQAFTLAKPVIFNSDQGSQFTSPQYLSLLEQAEVQISMDGKGRATDNIFTERLWRSLKYEEVYLHDYLTPREARLGISNYLDFYNHRRVHQALDYQTPAEVYFGSQRDQAKSSRHPHQWELTKHLKSG